MDHDEWKLYRFLESAKAKDISLLLEGYVGICVKESRFPALMNMYLSRLITENMWRARKNGMEYLSHRESIIWLHKATAEEWQQPIEKIKREPEQYQKTLF